MLEISQLMLLAVGIPVGDVLDAAQVVDGQQVAAGQVLIDHLGQVVGGQLDDGEHLGNGQRADRVLRFGW